MEFISSGRKASYAARKSWSVFFDFDNTIISSDILDNIITRFSVNEDRQQYEDAWVAGKIGSRECLQKQMQGIRVDRETLSEYLSMIIIDPYFKKLLALLKEKGIPSMIVSDSFLFLIREILWHNGIHGFKIFANQMKFCKDRIHAVFSLSEFRVPALCPLQTPAYPGSCGKNQGLCGRWAFRYLRGPGGGSGIR